MTRGGGEVTTVVNLDGARGGRMGNLLAPGVQPLPGDPGLQNPHKNKRIENRMHGQGEPGHTSRIYHHMSKLCSCREANLVELNPLG